MARLKTQTFADRLRGVAVSNALADADRDLLLQIAARLDDIALDLRNSAGIAGATRYDTATGDPQANRSFLQAIDDVRDRGETLGSTIDYGYHTAVLPRARCSKTGCCHPKGHNGEHCVHDD